MHIHSYIPNDIHRFTYQTLRSEENGNLFSDDTFIFYLLFLMKMYVDVIFGFDNQRQQCFKLKFSLSCPEMFRKFPSLYNLL